MSPSAIVRSQARETLKGNYVAAISASVILMLPIFIIMGVVSVIECFLAMGIEDETLYGVIDIVISTPVSIVLGILFSPIFNGYVRLFYRASLTREYQMSDLFYYFNDNRYLKTIQLDLSYLVRMMLPAILCFLPVFLYFIVCYAFIDHFVGTVLFRDLAFILTVMSAILLILYSLKYFVVFTLFCTDENADIKELFRQSKMIMAQQGASATKLIFSFTPWALLCLLILPVLYVVPYMTQSLCIGAKWMTVKGK